jgi:hypothetical protein
MPKPQKFKGLAHREGRTRSLQIAAMMRLSIRHKSLTLYPIELGGRLGINQIRLTGPCSAPHYGLGSIVSESKRVKEVVMPHKGSAHYIPGR